MPIPPYDELNRLRRTGGVWVITERVLEHGYRVFSGPYENARFAHEELGSLVLTGYELTRQPNQLTVLRLELSAVTSICRHCWIPHVRGYRFEHQDGCPRTTVAAEPITWDGLRSWLTLSERVPPGHSFIVDENFARLFRGENDQAG